MILQNISDNNLQCGWCGKDLSNATRVVYLNGNQPICDFCLMKGDRVDDYYEIKYYPNSDLGNAWENTA